MREQVDVFKNRIKKLAEDVQTDPDSHITDMIILRNMMPVSIDAALSEGSLTEGEAKEVKDYHSSVVNLLPRVN